MRAAARTISRRRAILVTLGAGWAGYGALGILANPRAGTVRLLTDITNRVPLTAFGWMWVVSGAIGILAGLVVACPRIQSAGYAALAGTAGLWGAAYTIATTRNATASGSACIWVAIAVSIVWAAGLDDPPPRHLRKGRRWT